MWPFISQINLNRYLILWQVNRSLVRLPPYPAVELSWVLANLIAERLPTNEARPWRKSLSQWGEYFQDGSSPKKKGITVPEAAWPVDAVLFVYPGKQTYGQGELILWELKLIGAGADHQFFLEVILPAMEAASLTTDPRWQRPNSLWGRFDIRAIYAARGRRWEPLVQDGKVDLRYRVLPTQWAEGIAFGIKVDRALDCLTWLTPFDLGNRQPASNCKKAGHSRAPTLPQLIEALAERLSRFILGRRHKPAEVWAILNAEEQAALHNAIAQAAGFPLRSHTLKRVPKGWPGRWLGDQRFLFIPDPILPYLELASILHLGRQTHFGCGTFVIG